jgi:NADH dehydrogenase
LREAKVLARNIHGVLNGRPPQPFVYETLGMMGSLGHSRAFGQLLKVRVHGVVAWLVRRTYYLLQMPGWSRRLRIMSDWTFALLFRPDIVKISLDSETEWLLHEAAAGAVPRNQRTAGSSGSSKVRSLEENPPRSEMGAMGK